MSAVLIVILLVAAQRIVELVYAARNTRALLDRGGVEVGRGHYRLFPALHAVWLIALFVFVPPNEAIAWRWFAVFLVLQMLRLWVIVSLGSYWTTRVITLPGAPLIRHGPYRFLRHPNYVVVAGEIAVLPLVFGAWRIALVFSLLNLALTGWRIRVEEQALAPRRMATSRETPDGSCRGSAIAHKPPPSSPRS